MGGFPRFPAWYAAPVDQFVAADSQLILGALAEATPYDLDAEQNRAWQEEIGLLKAALVDLPGWLYLEFEVPRLGSRIDAVLVSGPAIFPIEFKCGEDQFRSAHFFQAWDYALDLKNFHAGSHEAPIFPVLVATAAQSAAVVWESPASDGVRPPRTCGTSGLRPAILEGLSQSHGPHVDPTTWERSAYRPTPTIIEAARALYARHSVESISRNDAGATNLRVTSRRVEEIIEATRESGTKAIAFVTGVPGAGKTLVGLNVATRRRELGDARAVYLSGNGPLVTVLAEALVRDELARPDNRDRKGVIRQRVKPFIQNVHHFRDDGIRGTNPPDDRVVIFDEAQRAWTREKTSDFMRRRKGIADFHQSEPEFLISYLDRHPTWAVIVCLVGEGQEIHTGEAGIGEWFSALRERFPHWKVYVTPRLVKSDDNGRNLPSHLDGCTNVAREPALHLATSMRSFRSERVSAFVGAMLDADGGSAREMLREVSRRYPIAITRDLARARDWIRSHARGSERYGLVASSQALRLKPHAIDIRVSVDPIHWFLNDRDDTRSSFYMEDAATEFQVQGLELDWICVTWDADLRRQGNAWGYRSFRGSTWTSVRAPQRQRYLLNTYRVLLTRARQGMVIFVPPGDVTDATRAPAFYDETYRYLADIGISQV